MLIDCYVLYSEYMTYVMEALELEDTIKNNELREANGWFVYLLLHPSSKLK
jgi:hypothetical protein